MKLIPLSQQGKHKGKYFAQVDDEDYEWLMQWKWQVNRNGNTRYAYRGIRENKKRTHFQGLHRQIMGITDPTIFVDHKDHNGLNCQRNNLRIANNSQNQHNRTKGKAGKTPYKGVYMKVRKGVTTTTIKYCSRLSVNKKSIILGTFKTQEDAARAYDEAAKKYHGEFACLNFP